MKSISLLAALVAAALAVAPAAAGEIRVNPPPGGHKPEFDRWAWRPMADLPGLIVPFKRKVYEEVVRAFGDLAS